MGTNRSRRAFLASSGGIGAATIAGCTNVPETDSEERADADAGTVVSQHHLATEAGLEVLEEGGTAADAAITVACALSVVEPWFSSALGGGSWALYYDADSEEVTSVDGVGPVGSDATVEDFEERAEEDGMHQAVVPGAWDGWMVWLEEYGALDLEEVLSPAITLAREGYPVSEEMANWLEDEAAQIEDRSDAADLYMPEGDLLAEGETAYQEEMAETFESLVDAYDDEREEGRTEAVQAARDYFYRGPIAEEIVEFSDEHDGYLTDEDLEAFEAELAEPLSIEYDEDIDVYQNPPNSQGITQLLALAILREYDVSDLEPDDADAIHVQVEAIKLAFADRNHHVGDPERVDVPVEELLEEEYATSQRDRIDTDEAMEWPIDSELEDSDSNSNSSAFASVGDADHTSTFHVVDGDGNAAAVTTSLGAQFLVVGETGIHINNRMRMLSLEDENPNQVTPGYKVRHTSNPYLALRDGDPYILGGNTGVDTQPQGQTQQFLNVAEFGLDAQDAISHPRFVSTAFPATDVPHDAENTLEIESSYPEDVLEIESSYPEDVLEDLEDRGHDVVDAPSVGTATMLVLEDDDAPQIGAESRITTADGDTLSDSE